MNAANDSYNFEMNANFRMKKWTFSEISSFKVCFDRQYDNLIGSDHKSWILYAKILQFNEFKTQCWSSNYLIVVSIRKFWFWYSIWFLRFNNQWNCSIWNVLNSWIFSIFSLTCLWYQKYSLNIICKRFDRTMMRHFKILSHLNNLTFALLSWYWTSYTSRTTIWRISNGISASTRTRTQKQSYTGCGYVSL